MKIPVYEPSLSGNERKYVLDCLDSNWISSKGDYINRFEKSFSEKIGVKYSASVCNGTAALHLSMLALGIGPGDEVLVPTLTYVASVNAIKYVGAIPVFVDSDPLTWQIDCHDIKKKLGGKTKAILVVHLYGHPCDMDQIVDISKIHDLYVIEDCAEAFGSYYKGKHVGGFGDIATFSFFGNKTITTGEGGMVVTNDKTLHARTMRYKGQGLAEHRQYWHDLIGYNYRMTNICAAIGLAQMEQCDSFLVDKRRVYDWYRANLIDLPLRVFGEVGSVVSSFWMVNILLDDYTLRDELRDYLELHEIETRPLFFPVHTMPIYGDRFQRHPVAEDIASRGISLPSFPALREKDMQYICNNIKAYFSK